MRFCVALLLMANALLMGACASTDGGVKGEVPPSADSDANYTPVLNKWHRDGSVYHLFQKRIGVHGVLLTSEFRKAYLERMARLRGDSQSSLDESVGRRMAFLVSVTSPERAYENIDDKRLWNIALKYGNLQIQGAEVRPLSEKNTLDPFFPFSNQWSREFLVAFDPGGVTELPQSVTLVLKSALVSVEMEWRS